MSKYGGHGWGASWAALTKTRVRPVSYSTSEGKTIVEDEFLNFLVIKMKTNH